MLLQNCSSEHTQELGVLVKSMTSVKASPIKHNAEFNNLPIHLQTRGKVGCRDVVLKTDSELLLTEWEMTEQMRERQTQRVRDLFIEGDPGLPLKEQLCSEVGWEAVLLLSIIDGLANNKRDRFTHTNTRGGKQWRFTLLHNYWQNPPQGEHPWLDKHTLD